MGRGANSVTLDVKRKRERGAGDRGWLVQPPQASKDLQPYWVLVKCIKNYFHRLTSTTTGRYLV